MSELTQAQREAMERAIGKPPAQFASASAQFAYERHETIFLAGLRYQDEPSEAEVEAVGDWLDRFVGDTDANVSNPERDRLADAESILNAAKASREC